MSTPKNLQGNRKNSGAMGSAQGLSALEQARKYEAESRRSAHPNRLAITSAKREEAADIRHAETAIDPQERAELRASAAMFRAVARALEVAR